MIKINDYAIKNHLNEWEIKDLPEGEVYRLDLMDGDLTLLFYILNNFNNRYEEWYKNNKKKSVAFSDYIKMMPTIYIPYISNKSLEIVQRYNMAGLDYPICKIVVLDTIIDFNNDYDAISNITPNWSKHIPEDHAVLFLGDNDADKYSDIDYQDKTKIMIKNDTFYLQDDGNSYVKNNSVFDWNKKISIIIPSIHSKNIQEINGRAKELKEKYGVECVEVGTMHFHFKIAKCAYNRYLDNNRIDDGLDGKLITNDGAIEYIDKITTTDSTGILEVQKNDTLKVVDCKEFFYEYLDDNLVNLK